MTRARALVAAALLLAVAVGCTVDDDTGDSSATTLTALPATTAPGASVDSPEVAGPVTGGEYGVAYNPAPPDLLDDHGYVEEEWFFSGEATAYAPTEPLTEGGEWGVEAAGTAPYTTRMVVRYPADADAFNGTAVVEWLNVTAGRDSDPQWGALHPRLMAEGIAYVGVSAQATGVHGGGPVLAVPGVPEVALLPLKEWDPERYADLDHPGDEYSYDVYSQAAQAIRRPGDVNPLGGLVPNRVIAMGESQSAGRMVTYVNAVHPLAGIYDGFLVHSRLEDGTPIAATPDGALPEVARLRTDLDEPVLVFETETDLASGFLAARQPDTDALVTWEVAGTAHADQSFIDYGTRSGRVWLDDTDSDPTAGCGRINDGPQPEVLRAALAALEAWVVNGTPPPAADPIETDGDALARDEVGNALGGVRTPAVDVRARALSGDNPTDSLFCSLFGSARPLTAAELAERYDSHDDYVAQVTSAADDAVEAGFLLPADRDTVVEEAEASEVP